MKEHASSSQSIQVGMEDISARAEQLFKGCMPDAHKKAQQFLKACPQIEVLIEKTRELPLEDTMIAA